MPTRAAASRDTDGDGTPDYQDDDSDGDGIPDYREAGDGDAATQPIDTDCDGTPDFRDLDSDDNGRHDGLDGLDDLDGDSVVDFQDIDDDGDQINDIDEIGPNALQPTDTDNDGTPDFRDTDSDNDTILDLIETTQDYDMDGAGNYIDLDSDGDCIPDHDRSARQPARRHRRRSLTSTSSIATATTTACPTRPKTRTATASPTPARPASTNDDTDNDGVSDLIEVAAGTEPEQPDDNPQANGDFVFVEPYMKPQSPPDDDLDFSTKLQAVDMYVLLDRSGSMTHGDLDGEDNLSTVVADLTCPPLGTGTPATCIPDLWAGAGTIGYTARARPRSRTRRHPANPNFSGMPITEPSGTTRRSR